MVWCRHIGQVTKIQTFKDHGTYTWDTRTHGNSAATSALVFKREKCVEHELLLLVHWRRGVTCAINREEALRSPAIRSDLKGVGVSSNPNAQTPLAAN